MKDRITRIVSENKLFLVFLIMGIFLRMYQFEGFVTFLGDQGRDALIVKKIVTFEHFPAVGAPSSVGQIYLGPFYYYLIAPFLLLTSFDPIGLAIGVVLMWLIGIAVTYFVVKGIAGQGYALLLSLFLIFSSTLIDLSRFSWNPNLLPLFSFFTLSFLYRWLKTNEWIMAFLFGSFVSFSIQLHHLALFLVVPSLLWISAFLYQKKSQRNVLVKQCIASVGGFVFFSIPLIIFDLRHGFLNAKNFIALFTEGKITAENSYGDRFLETLSSFFAFALQIELNGISSLLCMLALLMLFILIVRHPQ